MDLLLALVFFALYALVIGLFARLALPGKDPLSIPQTIGVGAAGYVIAALVSYFLLGEAAGFLLGLVFAALIVYFIRRSRGGGLMRPGAPRRG